MDREPLIPKHGGYRRLKTFQIAQLIYDVTVRFCDLFINKRSRTHDQMVQAARSGVQNIAEGSQASGTSKKTELKLTNVARASLEELRLDYEDFLRQRGLEQWAPGHPALEWFRALRCGTLEEVRAWVAEEHGRARTGTDEHGQTHAPGSAEAANPPEAAARSGSGSVSVRVGPRSSVLSAHPAPSSVFVANAALSLLNLCCHLLDRQLASLAESFENDGGFTERLYHHRQRSRRGE